MKLKLKNKLILLTGACGGIGTAVAHELYTAGAFLVLVGRNESALKNLQGHLLEQRRGAIQDVHICTCDLAHAEGRVKLRRFVETLAQPVRMMINNAGISEFLLFEDQQPMMIDRMMQINAIAPMQLIRELLPHFKQAPRVDIINVGSTFGSIGFPGFSVYAASKFALRGFTEALSRELSGSSIQIKYFAPRATQTHLNSREVYRMNKKLKVAMDSPEKVARKLRVFVERDRNQMVVGWPEKLFVKLNHLFPAAVTRIICKDLNTIRIFAKQALEQQDR